MEDTARKKHWEEIYATKQLTEVSWYQQTPETSLKFFEEFKIPLNAKVIDVGGGDSLLVDHLLDLGYTNISVLDISKNAIERSMKRLGEKSKMVKWIVADASSFKPEEKYDLWHDRAAFHFLTDEYEIMNYINTVQNSMSENGVLVIGTFSEQGPKKCSGIEIKQYSEKAMTDILQKYFEKVKCITVDHETPSHSIQNFVFCSFKKRQP